MPQKKSNKGPVAIAQPSSQATPANPEIQQEEVKFHEDRYRVLIEDVADGFYEVDLNGNFKFFNDALCHIFGYNRHELEDRNYTDFMDEANARIAFEAFNNTYRSGKGVVDIKWEILRKDGQTRYLEISANLIIDDRGEKTGFRGIARDITDRFLTQKALKESQECALELSESSRKAEQRYRAFLNFLPDPVFVFNLDSTVSFLNPAFEKVFGWSQAELEGKIVPFIPDNMKAQTQKGIERLYKEKVIHGFETKRLTRDGRLLDMLIDGAIFYDEDNQPAGQVITLRDITRAKRNERINLALFRIAKALYQYRLLDERLEFITKEVRDLLGVEGAMVILLDEEKKEFYFREAIFDDTETGRRMKNIRYPVDEGIAGLVYRTGKPQIIEDAYDSPYFVRNIDQQADLRTRSMLDVPLEIQGRMIGVLCAVNKKEGTFDADDVELLSTIANLVALPIENAGINEQLKQSYEDVQSLNRAKDRVIHHLSHELKTPVSILTASLGLLSKRLKGHTDGNWESILERARRNLDRLLDMQYQIEDILREKDYKTHYLLSKMVEACADEIEILVSRELNEQELISKLRRHIDTVFGLQESKSEKILPGPYVDQKVNVLRPQFAHRNCRVAANIEDTVAIWIPVDVLDKVIEGLVRNAVENTPDDGQILVTVRSGESGPELEVKDTGIGMSAENQRLFFENYFTAYEPMQYSSRRPYDFQAGGKGFDLLRMKIFSERYNFKIQMETRRCAFIVDGENNCPGVIDDCTSNQFREDCRNSSGTTVTIKFRSAE